jgi:ESCRT-II complex subunit VPS22
MRRGVGVSAIMKKKNAEKKYDNLSKQMEKTKLDSVNEVMTTFKKTLEDFAGKHREKINSDPEFRQQFHKMCVSVGVDPLASSKGFWADLLGVGTFYFELGILVIQISLQTRLSNGGIISVQEILKIISTTGGKSRKDVSEEDIRRSVEKVSVMGSGFKIVDIRGNSMLLSVSLIIYFFRFLFLF